MFPVGEGPASTIPKMQGLHTELFKDIGLLQEDLESSSNECGADGEDAVDGLPDVSDTSRPLLADPKEKGLKRVGLVYSPRKSWWAGVILVALSVLIFIITIATSIHK